MNTIYNRLILVALILLAGVFSARAQTKPGNVSAPMELWLKADAGVTTGGINVTQWTDQSGNARNYTATTNYPTFNQTTHLMNFRPSIDFRGGTQKLIGPDHFLDAAKSYYVIYVSQQAALSGSFATVYAFNASGATARDNNYGWYSGAPSFTTAGTATANRYTHQGNGDLYGINTVILPNNTTNAQQSYMNGVMNSPAFGARALATGAGTGVIGSSVASTASTLLFNGNIQEIIILSGNVGVSPAVGDLDKVHSYLAIKYGVTLGTGNYVASSGATVWDRSLYGGYANNIFGIGRDNAGGLNQVQSRSMGSDLLTIYKGTLETLNNNGSAALPDQTFLMLGSNGLTGNVSYEHPEGTSFGGGTSITDKINYHTAAVYRAQVTGTPGDVNIKVNSARLRYVLVSLTNAFTPAQTRVYPITAMTATGVTINNSEYVAFAGYEATPGGVLNGAYTWTAWLTPDNYESGTWKNLITGTVGDFVHVQNAPAKVNSGYNFHPSVNFPWYSNPSAPYRLISDGNFNAAAGSNITTIFVLKRSTANYSYDHLLAFGTAYTNGSLAWYSPTASGMNNLSMTWNTSRREFGAFKEGILAVDNANNNLATGGFLIYKNGASSAVNVTSAGSQAITGQPIAIASGTNTRATGATSGYYGYEGDIQEVIILSGSGTNNHVNPADMQKIHSYLAIKYGFTLENSDNYINSTANVVWNRSSGYNNNIFGIGRDDASGLYQKQSRSVKGGPAVFLGTTLAVQNDLNTGILTDKQYLMIGAGAGRPIMPLTGVDDGEIYENGTADATTGFDIQSTVYETQITGTASPMTVGLTSPSLNFTYVLVSKTPAFTPGSSGGTKIYPINEKQQIAQPVVFDSEYKYFKFIGFAPGPGGVSPGLALWLRADDESSLTLDYAGAPGSSSPDPRLANYPTVVWPVKDPEAVPVVEQWSDYIRDHTYSRIPIPGGANQRSTVMEYYTREMNYHPAVRFWGSGTSYGSYLFNPDGILDIPRPEKHTTMLLVNIDFNTNAWVYPYIFAENLSGGATSLTAPGYGVERPAGRNYASGRFRGRNNVSTTDGVASGSDSLFAAGATTLLNYVAAPPASSSSQQTVRFRFNAKEEQQTYSPAGTSSSAGFDMTSPSILGTGYNFSRTIIGLMAEAVIFDRELDETDMTKVESYMALKYGITLSPNNATGRFDYKFSGDGGDIWPGNTGAAKFATYYRNVAAVIRDDAARLNNHHAISTNVGSFLHLGAAGTLLSDNGEGVGSLEDMEAVAFGCDNAVGYDTITGPDACGDFDHRFKRIWYVRKITQGNRPVKMLVGAQNNSDRTIGRDATVTDYYLKLTGENDITLVVGESPEKIRNGEYSKVIPMTYMNGEWQCSYEFSQEDTYITFGFKPHMKGCIGTDELYFNGKKKFSWTQWTSSTNTNPTTTTGLTLNAGPVDLGDGYGVASTRVSYIGVGNDYPTGVRATIGYPRSTSIPEPGSLEVRRWGGRPGVQSEVTVTIEFTQPVVPSFRIAGLDASGELHPAFEEVEIFGECAASFPGQRYSPTLSYAGTPSAATYRIEGSRATVQKRGSVAASNINTALDVKFNGGCTTITIKYRITGNTTTSIQSIYISPITFEAVPLPPTINEDGLSFVKLFDKDEYLTCEPVRYTFEIGNYNCDPKMIDSIFDTLPEHMRWVEGSFGLDGESTIINPGFSAQVLSSVPGADDGRTFVVEDLLIPGGGAKILSLSATAVFDREADTGEYPNRAYMHYTQVIEGVPYTHRPFASEDRNKNPYTIISATYSELPLPVTMNDRYSRKYYKENNEIEVTYTINNPNFESIEQLFMNISFNQEFTFVPGSFSRRWIEAGITTPLPVGIPPGAGPSEPNILVVAGNAAGTTGFIIPQGTLEIKFSLKAPAKDDLVKEVDEFDVETEDIVDLVISYSSFSSMPDPCLIEAIKDLNGVERIPYGTARTHIISNTNVTTRVVR